MKRLHFLFPLLLLLQPVPIGGMWEMLFRILLHGQETLEDYDSCGIFGEEEKTAEPNPTQQNRARIGDDYECLWDCEWELNPFYKSGDAYPTKILTPYGEQFPFVHTSPQLPKDLECLEDCFSFYKNPRNAGMRKKRDKKIAKCSEQGFDTLVPTHIETAVNFTASHFSDFTFWSDITETDIIETGPFIGSLNPNLDCLMLLESITKKTADRIGNFIPDTSFGGPVTEKGNSVLRASNPLSTAVEICAFAKLLQFLTNIPPLSQQIVVPPGFEMTPDLTNLFASGQSPTCDKFLPDVFSNISCRCVGTCDPRTDPENEEVPTSLLHSFDSDLSSTINQYDTEGYLTTTITTEPGLMGCQKACQQFPSCKFFTNSFEKSVANVEGTWSTTKHVCRLWKSCDSFQIPENSTRSVNQLDTISIHWSGPKDCGEQYTSCPLLPEDSDFYKGTSPWRNKTRKESKGRKKKTKRKRKESLKKQRRKKTKTNKTNRTQRTKQTTRKNNKNRAYGQSTSQIASTNIDRFPWLCSLKGPGFTGRHRCGVTLLSGPTSAEVVLVSAAHCNFVCKDEANMNTLEVCCCRKPNLQESCRNTSSHCGSQPVLMAAEPSDLTIVCNEYSLVIQPEASSKEDEVVLYLDRITNHPSYSPGTPADTGANMKGPYAGGDIAVYHLKSDSKQKLKAAMRKKKLWPACLPKKSYTEKRGIFGGWLDQEPFYRLSTDSLLAYEKKFLTLKAVMVEEMTCKDPSWMQSETSPFYNEETFYPAGTECYRDPSQGSCFLFGNSGSGLVRQFNKSSPNQHAYTGPLSMSKSCDQIWILDRAIQYGSENPGVFTDAYCYLPWIAAMYGMKLSENYTSKASCGKTIGNKSNINLEVCKGQDVELFYKECSPQSPCYDDNLATGLIESVYVYRGMRYSSGRRIRNCDFTFKEVLDNGVIDVWDECRLFSEEGYAYNIYICKDSDGNKLACANNCKGVDPNSVIIGGGAVLAAATVSGLGNLVPVLGMGGLAAAAGGAMMMNRCPNTRPCRRPSRRNPDVLQCCSALGFGGNNDVIRCPRRC